MKALTPRQLKMEHCHHGRAALVKPGWHRKLTADGYVDDSSYRCPDCGFRWRDEHPTAVAVYDAGKRPSINHINGNHDEEEQA